MADQDNVPHNTTTAIFGSLLGANFIAWYYFERTLSIHSIYTWRREAFYWLTVLFTFALGTSSGDQLAEDDQLGYWRVLVIVLGILAADYLIYLFLDRILKQHQTWISILTFWIAYILTRPLGASIGDLLTQPRYPQYDPSNCNPVGTPPDVVGCQDPDVYCITNCQNFPFDCDGSALACPYGYNTCSTMQPTCYTPLACPDCWGLDGIVPTNISFACGFVVLVGILTFTKWDQIQQEDIKEGEGNRELPANRIATDPAQPENVQFSFDANQRNV